MERAEGFGFSVKGEMAGVRELCIEGVRVGAMLSRKVEALEDWRYGRVSGSPGERSGGPAFSLVIRPLFSTNLEEREW